MSVKKNAGRVLALGSVLLSIQLASASDVSVGTFNEGYAVGLRNGTLIAERVHKATVGKRGCSDLGRFQNALYLVTTRTRSTGSRGSRFNAGFFQGYTDAVRKAVKETRTECRVTRFSDGLFPGVLLGSVYCHVAYEDPAALELMQFGPIYDGWSESTETREMCDAVFSIVTEDCGLTGIAKQLLASAQAAACAE